MKLLSTLLVLTFLVGCSDREKIEELEMEKAELQKELRARENELSEAEKIQIELDELQEQLAATGGGEKTVERYDNGQKKSEGSFKNGKLEGLWTTWDEDGSITVWASGIYKAGKKVAPLKGLVTIHYPSGQIRSETSYKNGKKEGISTEWRQRGQTYSHGSYKDGELEGFWTYWNEDGSLNFKNSGTYKADKKIAPHPDDPNQLRRGVQSSRTTTPSRTFWYENGQKRSEVSYKNGEKEGIWTFWYENGQKMREGSYKNGKLEGLWTDWDEDGSIDFEESGIYKNWVKIAPHPDDPNQ